MESLSQDAWIGTWGEYNLELCKTPSIIPHGVIEHFIDDLIIIKPYTQEYYTGDSYSHREIERIHNLTDRDMDRNQTQYSIGRGKHR